MPDENNAHEQDQRSPDAQASGPQSDGAPAATDTADPDRAERLAEIKRLAREGNLEAPSGAEEIADALAEAVGETQELYTRLQHTVADFQNYQRRATRNETEARRQGITGVLQSLIPVMDTFDMALNQDPAKASPQQIIDGVRAIKTELLRVLTGHGVQVLDPKPNDDFDPHFHEALIRQPAEGVEPGRVSQTLSVGYTLGERVVRPAKVSVAPGEE